MGLQYSHLWIGRSDDERVFRYQDVQDEAQGRLKRCLIESLYKDRKRLRSTLAGLIHPLDKSQLEQHRELVNIYTGEYSELDSTIYRAAEIGRDQHKRFEEALPDGFHSVISRLVIPMKPKKRHRRAVTTSVLISAEVIFSTIVGYLNSGRVEVTIVVALETELGPISVALVDEKKGCVL